MTLYNTTAYQIISADPANSLPDPTTVANRTHILANVGTAPSVWSSVGATPFTQFGVNVATITVPRAGVLLLFSDGAHWIITRNATDRRIFSGSGVTDASGNVTFTFTPPFMSPPVVAQSITTANTNATEARITALSTSSCTVNARQSPGVVILGISVLQVPQPLAGATVGIIAVDPGQI
jgi:hypothetical protein